MQSKIFSAKNEIFLGHDELDCWYWYANAYDTPPHLKILIFNNAGDSHLKEETGVIALSPQQARELAKAILAAVGEE